MATGRLLLNSGEERRSPARRERLRRGTPYPIGALPPELNDGRISLLLFCGPDRGGWRRGVRDEHGWHDPSDPEQRLEPSHFALARDDTKRIAVVLIGAVAAIFATLLGIGQVAYGDPWALCAPGREAADASAAPKNPAPR